MQPSDESLRTFIHLWGNAHSEALLEKPSHIFKAEGVDGVIAYFMRSNCAVTFGDPICPPDQREKLAAAFHKYCDEKNIHIIYLVASEKFANWAIQKHCKVKIEVGEEIIFDPRVDISAGHSQQKVRNYQHHAAHLGLKLHEYHGHNEEIERSIERVGSEWLKARRGPQIHLSNVEFFKNRNHKRWFYVKKNEDILGAVLLSKLGSYQGWLLKFLMSVPHAPRGTSELMMLSLLEILREESCPFLTYGMVPSANLGEVVGLNKLTTYVAKAGFKLTNAIFRLEQRKIFWKKFHPKTEKVFIVFNRSLSLKNLHALFRSLKIELFR